MSDTAGIAGTGYVDEEFFLGGTATAYRKSGVFGSDGKWQVTPASEAPYKTRLLVRRPSDPAKFNGTVVVEWFNVTAQTDEFSRRPARPYTPPTARIHWGTSRPPS